MKMINRFQITAPDGEVFVRVLIYPVGRADDHASIHQRTLATVMDEHPRCELLDLGWELKDDK